MLENFDPGVIPALKLMMKILQRADQECYDMISICGDIPTFTISWLLTWYSHIVNEFTVVQRLFDAYLS